MVQLTVKLAGLCDRAAARARRRRRLAGAARDAHAVAASYWNFWSGGPSGIVYLAMLGAGVRRLAGAAAETVRRARRSRGAARRRLNALGLLLYAIVPVAARHDRARALSRSSPSPDLALPTILMYGLAAGDRHARPGGGLLRRAQRRRRGAVHDDDVAVAGSLQALRRAAADDARILLVARSTTVVAGAVGTALAIVSPTVHRRAEHLLHAARRQPVRADPRRPVRAARRRRPEALAAIAAGVTAMLFVHLTTAGRGYGMLTPALAGHHSPRRSAFFIVLGSRAAAAAQVPARG